MVHDLGFRVQQGFRVKGAGFRVEAERFKVKGFRG
jgi:hypothetical protein